MSRWDKASATLFSASFPGRNLIVTLHYSSSKRAVQNTIVRGSVVKTRLRMMLGYNTVGSVLVNYRIGSITEI
jgi:hypothetical protein